MGVYYGTVQSAAVSNERLSATHTWREGGRGGHPAVHPGIQSRGVREHSRAGRQSARRGEKGKGEMVGMPSVLSLCGLRACGFEEQVRL